MCRATLRFLFEMDQAFGRLPPGKKLCLADILRINSTQHYNLDLTLSEAAYQTPGNEAIDKRENGLPPTKRALYLFVAESRVGKTGIAQ